MITPDLDVAAVPAAAPKRATYREAVRAGLRDALRRDPRVFLMGEDVGRYGGTYAVSHGLVQEFGEDRIRDTPLSETAFVGAGIGAAMGGMRPIVEGAFYDLDAPVQRVCSAEVPIPYPRHLEEAALPQPAAIVAAARAAVHAGA